MEITKTLKRKKYKNIFLKLIKYISLYKYSFFVAIFLGLCSTILNVVSPRLLAKIINELYYGITNSIGSINNNINISFITNLTLILTCMYLLSGLLLYVQNYLMSKICINLSYTLKKHIIQKINRLPISYFDKIQKGDIMSKLVNDVATMTSMLSHSISRSIFATTTIIGIIFMMYTVNWICATIALIIVPTTYCILQYVVKKSQKFFNAQQKFTGSLNNYIEENYSQHNIVASFNQQNESIKNFQIINKELFSSAWKSSFFSSLLFPIILFLGKINYLLVISVSVYLTVIGKISIGDISSFISYVKNLNQPMDQIADITSAFQKIFAASERVFDFLQEPEEKQDIKNLELEKLEKIHGNIRFENVSFGYKKEETVIKNLSFVVKAGQKAAFVGATGSGKSTIIKLLLRFYEADSGNIYIDDINIKEIPRETLRNFFSTVLQDSWFFSGTIAENIKYPKSFVSEKKIKNAARLAYADSFITTLPDNYSTLLDTDSNNISQGEKQLLSISRAVLSNNPILILDEATSSVDIATEKLIQKALDDLMNKQTSIVIAHRLSTIKNSDVIFVLSNGQIVESGSHDELIKKHGYYSEMYFSAK